MCHVAIWVNDSWSEISKFQFSISEAIAAAEALELAGFDAIWWGW